MDNIAFGDAHFVNGSCRIGENRNFHLHGLQNDQCLASDDRGASYNEDLEDRSNHLGLDFDRHRLGVRTLAVVGAALLASLLLAATLAHDNSSMVLTGVVPPGAAIVAYGRLRAGGGR